MEKLKNKAVFIIGPTASGKTDLGVSLAKKFDGEIISADSRQVYKEMDIGTAKPLGKWEDSVYLYKDIPHHLIDFLNPDEEYSVSDFKQKAETLIKKISNKGKLPFVVGGTGQYVQSLIENWSIPPQVPDDIVSKYENMYKEKRIDFLWEKLKNLDLKSTQFVQKQNPRRVIRALSVIDYTGEKFSKLREKREVDFEFLLLGIYIKREDLYAKIDKRVDEMIKYNLVGEVEGLLKKYGRLKSFNTIGYQEIIEFLEGDIDIDTAVQKIKTNTHKFVRHQMNWFKKMDIVWVNSKDEAVNMTSEYLSK